jgi:hypothetical protein
MKSILLSLVALIGLLQLTAATARAQETPAPGGAPAAVKPADPSEPRPAVSSDTRWSGVMVLTIIFLFFAAMVIGPIVRVFKGEPEPATDPHTHDDHGHDAHAQDPHATHGH